MHFVIYAGFIIINLEVLEILIDVIFGTHRIFAEPLGSLYPILINSFEFLAVGVIIVCVAFLARRNIIRLKRLASHELDGWPKTDANLILCIVIALMSLFLTMNSTLFPHPLVALIRTKFPWRKIIFNIAEHGIPFLGRIAFFHDKGSAQFNNDFKRTDCYRAFLHTGLAGGART